MPEFEFCKSYWEVNKYVGFYFPFLIEANSSNSLVYDQSPLHISAVAIGPLTPITTSTSVPHGGI
jgi:hypothetical protein